MSLVSFVGARYLRSRKGSGFISLITAFSIAGVALGVCTLIVTISVMDGFEDALRQRLAAGEFHILLSRTPQQGGPYFSYDQQDIAKIYSTDPAIKFVNPVLITEAILRSKKKVAGMTMRGITKVEMNSLTPLLIESAEGKKQAILSPKGIWLGKELAYSLNLFPGDSVNVISPIETEGPLESVPRIRNFTVEGIFETGLPEKDLHVAYVGLEAAQEFLKRPNTINHIEVMLQNFDDGPQVAEHLRENLGNNIQIKDWRQLNAHLFASLRLERITMFLILAMIVLVASFNIITSLSMMVMEKRKDIGILQAMGATQQQVGRIFLYQGAFIGNIGTFCGFLLGMAICILLQRYDFIKLPDIFYDRTLPVKILPLYISCIVVTAVLIVLFAAFFPARSASKISPLEAFRQL